MLPGHERPVYDSQRNNCYQEKCHGNKFFLDKIHFVKDDPRKLLLKFVQILAETFLTLSFCRTGPYRSSLDQLHGNLRRF